MLCTGNLLSDDLSSPAVPPETLSSADVLPHHVLPEAMPPCHVLSDNMLPDDLLCAEIARAEWEAHDVPSLRPECQDQLVSLCRELGIVIVPVGDCWHGLSSPLRLAALLGAGTRFLNSGFADRLHRAWARLGPDPQAANSELVAHILAAVRRDPGRRVLVMVRVERRFAVVDGLCRADEVALVPFWSTRSRRRSEGR